ncbi:MAG: hypothetical protein K9J21_06870 [Bacteroidales bacterium]|nr:hypothetical protein [Bacteroidales bacterium]
MQNKKKQITQEEVAENLLWGLWRSITEDYKCQYPREIWEHFENALRSASYTDSLKVFLTNFQRRIPIDIQAQYNKDILSVVEAGQDDTVLNWLRSETTYLIMLVRLRNQDRKELIKLQNEEL